MRCPPVTDRRRARQQREHITPGKRAQTAQTAKPTNLHFQKIVLPGQHQLIGFQLGDLAGERADVIREHLALGLLVTSSVRRRHQFLGLVEALQLGLRALQRRYGLSETVQWEQQ